VTALYFATEAKYSAHVSGNVSTSFYPTGIYPPFQNENSPESAPQ